MRMIPIVAVVPETILRALDDVADFYESIEPPEMAEIRRLNGWTTTAVVAGQLINRTLDPDGNL